MMFSCWTLSISAEMDWLLTALVGSFGHSAPVAGVAGVCQERPFTLRCSQALWLSGAAYSHSFHLDCRLAPLLLKRR